MRQAAQVVKRAFELPARFDDHRPRPRRLCGVARAERRLGEAEPHPHRDDLLLCAVVDVTLDPPSLGVRSGERAACAARSSPSRRSSSICVPARALRAVEGEAALLGEQVDEPLCRA